MNNKLGRIAGVLAAPVLLFIIFTVSTSGFGINSMYIITSQTMMPLVIGFGLVFCMMAGIFDLSVGSKIIFSAAIGGVLGNHFGIAGLIIGSVLAGVIFGALMGFLQNLLRIPSLVLSLGIVMLLEVISNQFLGKSSYVSISSECAIFGKAPYNIILAAALGILCTIIYYKTKFSYHVRMVGSNELLAKNMGISAKKINLLCYIVAGFFYGFAGIILISYSGAVSGTLNMSSLSMVFQPMMGVMIGMELLALIDNILLAVFIGEICISMIFNGLIAAGLPATAQDVALGIFILIVMIISGNKENIKGIIRRQKARRLPGKI